MIKNIYLYYTLHVYIKVKNVWNKKNIYIKIWISDKTFSLTKIKQNKDHKILVF